MKIKLEEAAIRFGVSKEILMQYAFTRKLAASIDPDGNVLIEKEAVINLLNSFLGENETQLLVE